MVLLKRTIRDPIGKLTECHFHIYIFFYYRETEENEDLKVKRAKRFVLPFCMFQHSEYVLEV